MTKHQLSVRRNIASTARLLNVFKHKTNEKSDNIPAGPRSPGAPLLPAVPGGPEGPGNPCCPGGPGGPRSPGPPGGPNMQRNYTL